MAKFAEDLALDADDTAMATQEKPFTKVENNLTETLDNHIGGNYHPYNIYAYRFHLFLREINQDQKLSTPISKNSK